MATDFSYNFLQLIDDGNSSLMFSRNETLYLTKKGDNGFYQTQVANKDYSYSGHRYVWASELGLNINIR